MSTLGAETPEGAEGPLANLELAEIDLWRCSRCGKWSHAKRRPRQHERRVARTAEGDVLLRSEDPGGPPDLEWRPYVISCGPFEAWRARRMPK